MTRLVQIRRMVCMHVRASSAVFIELSPKSVYFVACNVCKMNLQDSKDRTYGPSVICYISRVDAVQIVILP